MTATLTPPTAADVTRRSRPLTVLAVAAGAVAALVPLVVALVVALAGWFLTDAGAHGEPRDALRVGATAWLMAHGSGVTVRGVAVTAVPLGLTLLAAWLVWRSATGLGESVAGHGPDAEALADGDRDWTVPAATGLFASAYVLVAVVTGVLVASARTEPALGPVIGWSLLLTLVIGGAGVAVGSGRAAIWLSLAPLAVRATGRAAAGVLRTVLLAATLLLLGALVVDLGAAVNVLSRLHTDTGEAALFVLLVLLVLPNAVLWSASYLLGPGFLVGTGTLVSPSLVAVGPVPAFPLLAALPDNGPVPSWTPWLVLVPGLCAVVGVARALRHHPTTGWEQGALRGLVAGMAAGLVLGVLAALSGGAVGPGRMTDVGPLAGEVLVHAIVALGVGGLLGGLVATWRTRRREEPVPAR